MLSKLESQKELLSRINIYLVYLFLPFLPIMLPFYKMEPEFLCSRGISFKTEDENRTFKDENNYEINYYTCEKEKVCNNEYEHINESNFFVSFKYSYYYSLTDKKNIKDNKVHVKCHSMENSLINYFYLIYFAGVIIGAASYSRIKKNRSLTRLKHAITFISLIIFYIYTIVFLNKGININSIFFFIFVFNSGLFFYYISTIVLEQHITTASFIKVKRKVKSVSNVINILYSISGIIHIGLFYYFRHWIYNFILFSVFAFISFTIFILLEFYSSKLHCSNIDQNCSFDNRESLIHLNTIHSTEKFIRIPTDRLSLKMNKICIPTPKQNTSKNLLQIGKVCGNSSQFQFKKPNRQLKKFSKVLKNLSFNYYYYYMNFILFLIVSINYQIINSSFEHYSYSPFKSDTTSIFLFGFVIYFLEIVALFTYEFLVDYFKFAFLNLFFILILGVSLTVLQISLLNNYTLIFIVFLSIEKLFSMYLSLNLQKNIEKSSDCLLHRNQYKLTFISHLGVVVNFFCTYYVHYSFLVLACTYYICFLLIIKIIL